MEEVLLLLFLISINTKNNFLIENLICGSQNENKLFLTESFQNNINFKSSLIFLKLLIVFPKFQLSSIDFIIQNFKSNFQPNLPEFKSLILFIYEISIKNNFQYQLKSFELFKLLIYYSIEQNIEISILNDYCKFIYNLILNNQIEEKIILKFLKNFYNNLKLKNDLNYYQNSILDLIIYSSNQNINLDINNFLLFISNLLLNIINLNKLNENLIKNVLEIFKKTQNLIELKELKEKKNILIKFLEKNNLIELINLLNSLIK